MYERECDLCGATKRTVIEDTSERYICKACPNIGRTTLPLTDARGPGGIEKGGVPI